MPGATGIPALTLVILFECIAFGVFGIIYAIISYKKKNSTEKIEQ